MSFSRKEAELAFHFERMRESTAVFLRSVLENPSIRPEEKSILLNTLADRHFAIGQFIRSEFESGVLSAVEELRRQEEQLSG